MLRSAEEESYSDPEFAKWCYSEAEFWTNWRDSLTTNIPPQMHSSSSIDNIFVEESPNHTLGRMKVGHMRHQNSEWEEAKGKHKSLNFDELCEWLEG